MFEKEAEEYASNVFNPVQEKFFITRGLVQGHIAVAFKDGAEFGYNKANEWNYVKDGDLPKHEVNVLVLFNEQCIDIAHYNWDYKEWHFTDSIVRDVIAWKEIVLPKEIKENE